MQTYVVKVHFHYEIVVRTVLFALLIASIWNPTTAQKQNNDAKDVEVTVERSPYSLKFSISDVEKYELNNVTCSSISGLDQFANDENVCEDLLPCTTYRIVLSIKEKATDEIFNRDLINSTEYMEPQVNLLSTEMTTNSIRLFWATSDSACVLNYTIQVKSAGNNIEKIVNNKQNDYLIDGLSPCVEHAIEMRTYDFKENLISILTETKTTDRAEPGIVSDIKIDVNFESGHAKVTWNQPENKTCIDFYYVKWFTMDCGIQMFGYEDESSENGITEIPDANAEKDTECQWFSDPIKQYDSNEMEYILKDLNGCEDYGVQIFINDKENAKSDVENFTSGDGMPDEVILKDPAKILIDQVTLHWEPQTKNRKCIKKYRVLIEGPIQRPNLETHSIEVEDVYADFDHLEPCGMYLYTITPLLLNGTAGSATRGEFETLEATPTVVRHIQIIPQSYAFTISWDVPAFADLCVKEYNLAVWTNGKSSMESYNGVINDTRIEIPDLIACQSYTIQIYAITKHSANGEQIQFESETAPAISQPPYNFQFTDRYSDGLELSTKSNDANNTCDIIFARFICLPNGGGAVYKKSAERNVEGRVGGTSFKTLLAPLSPFTEYSCFARFFNIAGWSSDKQIIVSTLAYYAEKPREISVKYITHSSVTIKWEPPLYPNGNINYYMGHFQRVRPEYVIPPNCRPVSVEVMDRVNTMREMVFNNLQPHFRYSIQLAAENEYGVGEYTRPFFVVTKPILSEPVKDLTVLPQGPYESVDEYGANVLVSWTLPCRSNGEIESFQLEFRGERGEEVDHFFRSVAPKFKSDGRIQYNETYLKADFHYTVDVVVRNVNVEGTSLPKTESFDAPTGIPKRFNESTAKQARVSAFAAPNPTSTAVVRFPAHILDSDTGSIIYVALLISQRGCNEKPALSFGALNSQSEWPNTRKWQDVYLGNGNNCIPQYQTTKERWVPLPMRMDADEIEFTIGTENCNDCRDPDGCFCNGPLTPETEYYLVIRLFTRSGYNDAVVLEFHTDSLVRVKVVVVSVACCLLFAFVAGFIYIYITKRMLWKRQSYHDIEDPFGDIITKNFAKYYNEISRPEKLSREFKELTMVAMDFSYAASEIGHNKNRYVDIYPYDKNRVILDIDADGSDYINASFINGYRRKKEFIATQGPKPESTLDFWRMILQHNIRVIVMVTQFREGDKIKCHEYFPYKSSVINVTVKKKETFDLYDRREMTVTHDRYGLKQKVVHFYFKKWPDHGCPDDPMHLITFVRKVKAEKVPSYSSIVVHCSAGVGRTGTFIGLDIIMQRIKSESKINIYGTVKKLRFQRMKMVQSLEQYMFLYKCAYELVKHKTPRAPVENEKKEKKKRVTFKDDDMEANSSGATTALPVPPSIPVKSTSRGNLSELGSIEENEMEYNESVRYSSNLNENPCVTMKEGPASSSSLNSLDNATNCSNNRGRITSSIGTQLEDMNSNESSM